MADDIVTRLRTVQTLTAKNSLELSVITADAADQIELLCAAGDKLAEAHIDDLCDCNQPECVTIREAHVAWQEARRG